MNNLHHILSNTCGASGDYATITEAMRCAKVMEIKSLGAGKFRATELCDEFHSITLTADQVMAWADELKEMAEGNKK